jgi:hypothetical protein
MDYRLEINEPDGSCANLLAYAALDLHPEHDISGFR